MDAEDVIDILRGTAFDANSMWCDGIALAMDACE